MGKRPNTSQFDAVKKGMADAQGELCEFARRLDEIGKHEAAEFAADCALEIGQMQSRLIEMLGQGRLPEPAEVKQNDEDSGS